MFENVVTAGDTIEGPTLFRQLPDQLRAFHGVYCNHHQESSQHYTHHQSELIMHVEQIQHRELDHIGTRSPM
jgi:hypothetical protein